MTTPRSDAAETQTVRDDLLPGLRGWQKDAYHEYFRLPRRDFLLVATPGAGKTTYALTVAAELLARREVAFLTIVTPTEHLKHQWAAAAARFGIAIDSAYRNAQGRAGADFAGVAVTYAQVAAHPALHRQRTENRRTLVIFDEIHHAGDALSWGDAVKEAFDPARRRLALTGTPFRSDANPIPFVTYLDEPGGGKRSASDYVYGYGPALEDGVVRPVIFLAYSGEMRWRTRAGDEITATLGTPMTKDQIAQAWRTALDPAGEWVSRVLEAADKRLTEVRRGMPDAGGLVIAGDHEDARAYAALLRGLTGKRPVVVLSDDKTASKKISAFAASDERWMVAVRMVSEGVDIPRLAVGVYATSVSTALFFAQAVGRFVRARQRGETAFGVPAVGARPALLRRRTRGRTRPRATRRRRGRRGGRARAGRGAARARHPGRPARRARLHRPQRVRALRPGAVRRRRVRHRHGGRLAGGRGLPRPARPARPGPGPHPAPQAPGLPASRPHPRFHATAPPPAPPATLRHPANRHRQPPQRPGPAAPPVSRQALAALRKELNGLVGAWSHRTGQPHGVIHNELRRTCGGPPLPQATADQIQRPHRHHPPLGHLRPLAPGCETLHASPQPGLPTRTKATKLPAPDSVNVALYRIDPVESDFLPDSAPARRRPPGCQ